VLFTRAGLSAKNLTYRSARHVADNFFVGDMSAPDSTQVDAESNLIILQLFLYFCFFIGSQFNGLLAFLVTFK